MSGLVVSEEIAYQYSNKNKMPGGGKLPASRTGECRNLTRDPPPFSSSLALIRQEDLL